MKIVLSSHLLGIVIFYVIGIIISMVINFSIEWMIVSSVFLLSVYFLVAQKRSVALSVLFLLIVLAAMIHTRVALTVPKDDVSSLPYYLRKENLKIEGIVVSEPVKKRVFNTQKVSFVLRVKSVYVNNHWLKKKGRVLVDLYGQNKVNYGDLIVVEGKLHKPFNFGKQSNFSYAQHLKNKGIHYIFSVKKSVRVEIRGFDQGFWLRSLSLSMRHRLSEIFKNYLSKNEAAIMQALILGDRLDIPRHIMDLFEHTGTTHILAISGQNIGVVALIFLTILKLFSFKRQMLLVLTIILLFGYAFLTGSPPSVVRATIMSICCLSGLILEKPSQAINLLSFAALIILIYDPLTLYDIGFQLSFICVLAIIIFIPNVWDEKNEALGNFHLKEELWGRRLIEWIIKSLGFSLGVWIAVAGVIAYYFNIITPVVIVANLFIVPLLTLVIILGFGLLLCSAVSPLLAGMLALCLKLIINLMVGIIFLFDQIPYAYVYVSDINHWHLMIYYIILFIFLAAKVCVDKRMRL